ncbi:elongation factor P--(R)-beta-lysine ligase [Litorilituus lipolyticus]|uniref:Elongation factor P--(R)-beta-lysine ligase n=1 Tax=Litorilituus lipolyticus TaxID=2491017 RepID=A0A502L0Y3_9GAMM|nr:elongation factor P--(R)-beta-lysine ligase [Litorilituus lipolyticus]TPH16135.1 elongation factor P--(R)-beta-lysine ligase [Litorilituus lipolyticus]
MNWQPTLSWQHAKKRADIIKQIRGFFAERDVVEVETPALSQGTVTDVHLEGIKCQYDYLSNSAVNCSQTLYLQTSPEFHMKRLLASGYGDIYQICKSFRHEGFGSHHNPEFTMLEWYRKGFDHFALMKEVSDLLATILKCQEPIFVTYQELFKRYVNIDPLVADRHELLAVIKEHDKLSDWLNEEVNIDTLLQFIFSEIIEQHIGGDVPYFVYNFPARQASLAKLSSEDPRVARRFECYFHGIELANGFDELIDPIIQLERFKQDNKLREQSKLESKAIDEHFIFALKSGLPECAGVALGIDRLVMLALQTQNIEDVLTFSIENA